MRICFPLPPIERYSPVSGGAIATCVMQIVRGLVDRGHQVTVLADNHGDSAYDAGDFVPIDVPLGEDLSLWRRGLSKLRYRWHRYDWPRHDVYLDAVRRGIRNAGVEPDVIVVENDLQAPAALKRAFPKSRQVLWLHNEQGTRHRNPKRLLDAADAIVTNSDYIRRYTAQRFWLNPDRFTVVHNGVDLESFTPRADYDSPRSPVKVLYLGRIDPNKGVDLAVDAVAALRREGLAVEMTVAGGRWFFDDPDAAGDPYFVTLQQKMETAEAQYMGHVSRKQVPALVREHDIVCVFSRSQEPFGLVALEAMASGCAVVASDRGGLPEACGGAARLVDVDDLHSVIGVVRGLVTDQSVLRQAKQASVRRAARAGWDRAAAAFEALLRQVSQSVADGGAEAAPDRRLAAAGVSN